MSKFKMVVLFILILLLVIIIFQNQDAVTFRFLLWKIELSLFAIPIIAIVSMIIGFLIAKIFSSGRNKKNKDQVKEKIIPPDK